MNNIKEVHKKSHEIENWKYQNCYDENKIDCRTCCSGGMMLGIMCEEILTRRLEGENNKTHARNKKLSKNREYIS